MRSIFKPLRVRCELISLNFCEIFSDTNHQMTWLQMFMAYYVGYQLISFLNYCYKHGRQGTRPGSERWMDYFQTEGEDTEQELLGVSGQDEQGEGAQAEGVADAGAVGESSELSVT